ncbi:MAG: AbrB/MazE/SpoVT family DNA-binding domain-containing protein [Nitrososphaerota archaeon]
MENSGDWWRLAKMLTQRIIAVRKIYGHGRVQIPVEIRKNLGLDDGDKLIFVQIDGAYFIRKADLTLEPVPPLVRTTRR